MYAAVASVSISTTGGSVIGITKPLTPLFPVSGDDPAFISFYFGDNDEDSTLKRAKEQPDQPAMIAIPGWSLEDRRRLIDRERGLLDRESTLAGAFLNVCSVVERVRHRTALLLRFRGSFRAFSLERSRLDGVSPYQISSHFFQKLVDELDGHGAFADGGGDAFD